MGSDPPRLDFSTDPPAGVSAGIRGLPDFRMVPCEEGGTCEVQLSLAGLGLQGPLHRLSPADLFGPCVMTKIELGGTEEEWPVPTGMTLALNQTRYKAHYAPLGRPGNNTAWGFGTKVDLAYVFDALGLNSEGDQDAAAVGQLLFLEAFVARSHSAAVSGVEMHPVADIEDTGDIDGDPGTGMVPDYDRFMELDLAFKVATDRLVLVDVPPFPDDGAGGYRHDAVLALPGVLVRGAGFVPLGAKVARDSHGVLDPADGRIENPFEVRTADIAGRIPENHVQRVVLVLALDTEHPGTRTGQVLFLDSFDDEHSLEPFMEPPKATWDPETRELTFDVIPEGTDLVEVLFEDERGRRWRVTGEPAGTILLPPAPPEGDRAATFSVTALELVEDLAWRDLIEFGSRNPVETECPVRRFSR